MELKTSNLIKQTYKQARVLGGNVKKGERSTPVVYWLVSVGRSENDSRVGEEEQENSTCI